MLSEWPDQPGLLVCTSSLNQGRDPGLDPSARPEGQTNRSQPTRHPTGPYKRDDKHKTHKRKYLLTILYIHTTTRDPPSGGHAQRAGRGLSHGPERLSHGLAAPRRATRARRCAGKRAPRRLACRGGFCVAAAGARKGASAAKGGGSAEEDGGVAKVKVQPHVVAL